MSRKKVFSGRLLNVFEGNKKLPNGKKSFIEEVRHPGAALMIASFQGKVIFIRQYRPVIGKYIWELPAGLIDTGETPYACAKREITEETGYVAKNIRRIGVVYTSPGFCDEQVHIYRADSERRQAVSRDDEEVMKVKLLNQRDIRRLFEAGRISDAKTIAALSFAGIL